MLLSTPSVRCFCSVNLNINQQVSFCHTIPTSPASSFLHDEPRISADFSGLTLFMKTPKPRSSPDHVFNWGYTSICQWMRRLFFFSGDRWTTRLNGASLSAFDIPPSVARSINARSLISFCVIFENDVMCLFGYIQNSYG